MSSTQNFALKFQGIIIDTFKQWLWQKPARLTVQKELRFLIGLSMIPNDIRLRLRIKLHLCINIIKQIHFFRKNIFLLTKFTVFSYLLMLLNHHDLHLLFVSLFLLETIFLNQFPSTLLECFVVDP